MKEITAKQKVIDCWAKGYCCSESIVLSALNDLDNSLKVQACKAASGFCGGVGRTHSDVCGTLTGGIIALGYLYGRESGEDSGEELYKKTAEFRRRFLEQFGSTCCEILLGKKGDNPDYCRDLTATAAEILSEIIRE